MQYLNIRKAHRLIMALALFTGGSQTALAVGTPSGDTISNRATVDYQVGTDPRSTFGDAPDITVDNRVDVTVANLDGGNVNVTPGLADRVQTYTVTNTGNTTQGYYLSTAIPTTDIPMGSVEIWLDTNGNGSWDGAAGDTQYTPGNNAFDLDPNGVIGTDDVYTVFVVADTPAGAVNGDQDDVRLVAETRAAGGGAIAASGAPTGGIDIVFADGTGTTSEADRDGQHSAAANYTVTSASLALGKTILGTTDEFTSGFAIPGAIVEYQLRVTNSGTGTVDNNTVIVTDAIPTGTKVCVAAACGGAASFVDGAPVSGLTAAAFEYSKVAGATACDNASFVGAPLVIDGDGADAAVTCIRQRPTGAMNGSGGFFDVRFFVVIE